ncbi:hypothetical protein DPX16_7521 [Anabarilius grahami]|uniref:Chemokine interleukin-8-like domain-containing protein n=1 Tax=Anabarilius grahami TaxID=495550 RepID=A0A3N0YST3_ANAGA|nr:hypothetical protein DPX16_7521 [Anabarilius grahami]
METQRILMRSLAVMFIASVIWTITDAPQRVFTCCTAVSTVEFTDPVIGVRLQKQSLPCVKAVLFETKRGELCCDPRQSWVKEKCMQFIVLCVVPVLVSMDSRHLAGDQQTSCHDPTGYPVPKSGVPSSAS